MFTANSGKNSINDKNHKAPFSQFKTLNDDHKIKQKSSDIVDLST